MFSLTFVKPILPNVSTLGIASGLVKGANNNATVTDLSGS